MRILVTGGAGFIGSHISEYHLNKNDQVKVVDDLSTGSLKNIATFAKNPNFEFVKSNLLTWPDLSDALKWADRIYHMGAVLGVYRVIAEPTNVLSVNITGTEHLLKSYVASQAKGRLIIASSSSVYCHSSKPLLSEKDDLAINSYTQPLWLYALSKIADEGLASAYFQSYKIPVTSIRLFNTIGPRQTGLYGMVVPRFVQQACDGEALTVYGDGSQTRSFCDVRDSVVALDIIAEKNLCIHEPINVGNDVEITINDLAKKVCQRTNSSSAIKHIPYEDAYGKAFIDVQRRRPDLSKLRELTGYQHKYTLDQTIDDLIASYAKSATNPS